MRIGQKNNTTYQWAEKGSRPRQPADQRYQNAYLFGAFCPERDTAAGLVMPRSDTLSMAYHLAEISAHVAVDGHAIVLMDQASWHTTPELEIPNNISILHLPPASPELNPSENIWQFLRQTYLSRRIFKNYEDIVDWACRAWCALLNEPGRIQSITYREWADTAYNL